MGRSLTLKLFKRIGAMGLSAALAFSLSATAAYAEGDSAAEAASHAEAAPTDEPTSRAKALSEGETRVPVSSPIVRGLCDFLTSLEGRVDACGQEIIAEKDLEHARRNDEVSEKLRIEALNSKGDAYQKTQAAAEQIVDGTATVDALTEGGGSTGDVSPGEDAPSASNEDAPKPSEKKRGTTARQRVNTIRFNGEYIAYEQGTPADETAPASTAAAWVSDGDVTDGENTYFIGHNPGVFSGVMDLGLGDEITVWDGAGRKRNYYVFDVLTLPNQSNYFRYEGRIAPSGESVTLQTCCADNLHVRCVMAR